MLQQHAEGQPVQLPPSLSLSSEKLQEDGVYLAENGYDGYIYFAQQVPTHLVRALLGEWHNGHSYKRLVCRVLPQWEAGSCLQQFLKMGHLFVST